MRCHREPNREKKYCCRIESLRRSCVNTVNEYDTRPGRRWRNYVRMLFFLSSTFFRHTTSCASSPSSIATSDYCIYILTISIVSLLAVACLFTVEFMLGSMSNHMSAMWACVCLLRRAHLNRERKRNSPIKEYNLNCNDSNEFFLFLRRLYRRHKGIVERSELDSLAPVLGFLFIVG